MTPLRWRYLGGVLLSNSLGVLTAEYSSQTFRHAMVTLIAELNPTCQQFHITIHPVLGEWVVLPEVQGAQEEPWRALEPGVQPLPRLPWPCAAASAFLWPPGLSYWRFQPWDVPGRVQPLP